MPGRKKMRPKAHRAAKFSGGKKAPKIVLNALLAARALEIYDAGGNRETFVAQYGVPCHANGTPMNAEQLLEEAMRLFLGDEARKQMAARVTAELARIGFADAGDYFEWGPQGVTLKPGADLTREQRAAVAEVSQTVTEAGGTIRLKLYDKTAALRLLAQGTGEFAEKVEHTGKDGGPLTVEIIRFGDDQAAGQ